MKVRKQKAYYYALMQAGVYRRAWALKWDEATKRAFPPTQVILLGSV